MPEKDELGYEAEMMLVPKLDALKKAAENGEFGYEAEFMLVPRIDALKNAEFVCVATSGLGIASC